VQEIAKAELDSARIYRIVPRIRVGEVATGTEAREFGYIADVAIDSRGTLYVWDTGYHQVRVVRSDGKFSHVVGEPGSGPKSLGSGRAIAIAGDTLIVWTLTGLKYFRTNGALLGTKQWSLMTSSSTRRIRTTADSLFMFVTKRGGLRGARSWADTVLLFATSKDLRTPVTLRASALLAQRRIAMGNGLFGPPLLGMNQQWGLAPDGTVIITDRDSFAIHLTDVTGAPIKTVIAHLPPVPTTRADLRDFRTSLQRTIDDSNRQFAEDPIKLDLKGSPKRFRPFLGGWFSDMLGVSSSGQVIVQRFDLAHRPYNYRAAESLSEWLIFSPAWKVEGKFTTPAAFTLKLFEGCTIYGIETGEFDEQVLVSYILEPALTSASTYTPECDGQAGGSHL
jgi:hypothetical protein